MNKQIFKDTLGWGFLLWLIGYVLGIILFMLVPADMIGWVITPIATLLTLWVLFKKIHGAGFHYYTRIALSWAALAVSLDYIFIVQLLKPADGYYKADIYLYYALTLALPLIVGWAKKK